MSEGAGPVPSPSQWARVQLAQGQSGAGLWDLSTDVPEARITVGSAQGAGWIVEAPDVAPVHFELFWDGNALWVSPPHDGELTVDGERVQSWRQLVGRSRVEFGRAAFLVETSQTIAVPGAADATEPLEETTATGAGLPRVPSPHVFDDDPTAALIQRPDLDSVPPLASDATQMVDGSQGGLGVGRPMLGGVAAPSAEAFVGDMKTQILDTEAAGIDLRPSPAPGPPPSFTAPHGGPPPSSPGPALGRERQIPTDVLQVGSSSASETGSQFALPPVDAGAKEKKKLELPPRRTLILAGVTLLLAVIVLGSSVYRRRAQQAAVEAAQARNASQNASTTADAIRARAAAAAEERAAAIAAHETALREQIQASLDTADDEASVAAEEAAETAARENPEEPFDQAAEKAKRLRFAVQKLAVDALVRNDQSLALAYYLWLNETYPDHEAYGPMVEVLRKVTRREENR